MLNFLKVFGRGIVVTILSPLFALGLAFYLVYCLVLFIIMFFWGVIGFFRGNNINADLPEDLEAKRLVLENEKSDEQAKDMLNVMYQSMAQAMINSAQAQAQAQSQAQPKPPVDVIDYLTSNEEPQQIEQTTEPQEGEENR